MSQPFQAVIFDMDGTLVDSRIDFAVVRADLGVPADRPILETLDAWPRDRRQAAYRRLMEHERAAAQTARLCPRALETLAEIRQAGLKVALLTRNARPVMEEVLERFGLRFDLAWSREAGPIKPQPDGILRACRELGVAPANTMCVGDFHYDILAANAAGAVSVLLSSASRPSYAAQARHVIAGLAELPALLGIA